MSRTTFFLLLTLLTHTIKPALAQKQEGCENACVSDVSGTNCTPSQWSCLCQSETYLNRFSSCATAACNSTDYDGAISDIAQLCSIVSEPVSVLSFATVSTGSYSGVFTTVGVVSSSASMPSVYSTSGTASNRLSSSMTSITSMSHASTTGQTSTVLPTLAASQASSTMTSAVSSISTTSSSTTTSSAASSLSGHWKFSAALEYFTTVILMAWALCL